MQFFNISDSPADACNSCCCYSAYGKPGQTDKWALNYSAVVLPANGISLTKGTCFDLELHQGCENGCPQDRVSPLLIEAPVGFPVCEGLPVPAEGMAISGSLVPSVDVEEGATLRFEAVRFAGPRFGRVAIAENGDYSYTPQNGFRGIDRFFWQVSINGSPSIIQEAVVGVCAQATIAQLTPAVAVVCPTINDRSMVLNFGVSISPAARPGDVWRLTIKQGFRDCSCCYDRIDCFDIEIGTCR